VLRYVGVTSRSLRYKLAKAWRAFGLEVCRLGRSAHRPWRVAAPRGLNSSQRTVRLPECFAYWVLMECRGTPSVVQMAGAAHIIDRAARNQLRSFIPDPPSALMMGSALSGKIRRMRRLDRWTIGPTVFGILWVGQAHHGCHFADVDQLAKEIIRKKNYLCQSFLRTRGTEPSSTDTPCVIVSTTC